MALAQAAKNYEAIYTEDAKMANLMESLDTAIDDMENGRVQTIDAAWEEIDAI